MTKSVQHLPGTIVWGFYVGSPQDPEYLGAYLSRQEAIDAAWAQVLDSAPRGEDGKPAPEATNFSICEGKIIDPRDYVPDLSDFMEDMDARIADECGFFDGNVLDWCPEESADTFQETFRAFVERHVSLDGNYWSPTGVVENHKFNPDGSLWDVDVGEVKWP